MSNRKKVTPIPFSHRRPIQVTARGRKLAELSDKDLLAWFVERTGPGDPAPLDLLRVFRAINGYEKEQQ